MNVAQIRDWLVTQIFDPLKNVHGLKITLRAGDIHSVLGLTRRQPSVCQALRTVSQYTQIVVLHAARPGANVYANQPNGANVWYTYEIR